MAEENEGEKKKSSMKLIVIILTVVVLAGGGVVGWLLLSGGDDAPMPSNGNDSTASDAKAGISFSMDTFVVNLNDPGGKRYLKTKIEIEYTDEQLVEELKQRLPQLRDVILLLLSSKTLEDIQGIDGKIALRRELILRINQALKKGKVRNLYFTQFVIQ